MGEIKGKMSNIIGRKFKAWDGRIYICTSKDRAGYWMETDENDGLPKRKTNVNQKAIGSSFRMI